MFNIPIKSNLLDFLRENLSTDKEGSLIINRKTDVGLVIFKYIDFGTYRKDPEAKSKSELVQFTLPSSPDTQYKKQWASCSVHPSSIAAINRELAGLWKNHLDRMLIEGHHSYKVKKDIYKAINSRYPSHCVETVKKYDDRQQAKIKKLLKSEC